MKCLKYFAGMAMSFLLLTSCSKEDQNHVAEALEPELATLSFGAVLNDLKNSQAMFKQSMDDLPACSDDEASYVRIILSRNGNIVVGSQADPFRIDLVANQIFTEEVAELQLTPGIYSLDYFAVYNAGGELIWLAPNGGNMSDYFDNPMPLSIDLLAGVKKYVEVSVLCFDNRFVNEYGFLFFELNTVRAIRFCVFGNYCDTTGRHYPARFSVSVWKYANGTRGANLYTNVTNEVALNDAGDYAGSVACVTLPDSEGQDEYYLEITLLNSDAYGDVEEEVIRSGVFTDADVRALFDGANNVNYYHFRAGCQSDDTPALF